MDIEGVTNCGPLQACRSLRESTEEEKTALTNTSRGEESANGGLCGPQWVEVTQETGREKEGRRGEHCLEMRLGEWTPIQLKASRGPRG